MGKGDKGAKIFKTKRGRGAHTVTSSLRRRRRGSRRRDAAAVTPRRAGAASADRGGGAHKQDEFAGVFGGRRHGTGLRVQRRRVRGGVTWDDETRADQGSRTRRSSSRAVGKMVFAGIRKDKEAKRLRSVHARAASA